jgi:hypothetical protein
MPEIFGRVIGIPFGHLPATASARFKLPADVYGQDLVFCVPLFCVIRSQIQI